MHCNGKCYLMQQLAKEAQKQKDKTNSETFKYEIPLLFCHNISSLFDSSTIIETKTSVFFGYNTNKYTYLLNKEIFKPPISLGRF